MTLERAKQIILNICEMLHVEEPYAWNDDLMHEFFGYELGIDGLHFELQDLIGQYDVEGVHFVVDKYGKIGFFPTYWLFEPSHSRDICRIIDQVTAFKAPKDYETFLLVLESMDESDKYPYYVD